MRRGSRGLYDGFDIDPEAVDVGVMLQTRSGWKYDGSQNTKSGLIAQFHYSVEVLNDGEYREDPALSQSVMTPSRLAYTLPEMEKIKAERLFIIAVPEKILDQGIESLRGKLAAEQAAREANQNGKNSSVDMGEGVVLKVA